MMLRIRVQVNIFILSLLLVINLEVIGQEIGLVTGLLKTEEGKCVSQAHVVLLDKTLKIVAHGVSDDKGVFELIVAGKGDYKLNISCVGYEVLQRDVSIVIGENNLGVIHLKEGVLLDEVSVTREKSLLVMKADRIVYEVERDSMAKNSAALQILEKLPFVRMDMKTKQLQVMGGTNFVITINGEKSLFLSEANQYVARLLRGDKMKQVELITSPQGKYSDKTAVINIVTKGSLPDGIVGNVIIDFGKEIINPDIGLTSKIGKFVYNVNYKPGYVYYSKLTDRTRVINYENDTVHETESELTTWSKDDSQELQLNASYDISDRDLLTFGGQYTYYREREFQEGKTVIRDKEDREVKSYLLSNRNTNREEHWTGNINYQKTFRDKAERLLTATYNVENNQDRRQYNQALAGVSGIEDSHGTTRNKLRLTEHTVGIDYTNPVSDRHSYFLTAKFVAREYRSGDELNYNQYVPAFRASYSFTTPKINLRAEVNLEKTINDMQSDPGTNKVRKTFFDVTPSATAIFLLSRKSTLSIIYSVPSFRPDIYYLNPFVDSSEPSHWRVGNPDLEPEKSQYLNLKYRFNTLKTSLNVSASYKHSGNAIYPYDYTHESGALVTTYGNMNRSEMLSFNVNFEYSLPGKLQLWCDGEAKYTYYSIAANDFPLWNFKMAAGVQLTFFKKATVGIIGNIRPISTSVQNTKFRYLATSTLRGDYPHRPRG